MFTATAKAVRIVRVFKAIQSGQQGKFNGTRF
jgi:hypothetical protein